MSDVRLTVGKILKTKEDTYMVFTGEVDRTQLTIKMHLQHPVQQYYLFWD